MKSESKIIDILMSEFSSVSCTGCSSYPLGEDNKEYKCRGCEKHSNWSLHEGYAKVIASKISD